MRTLDQETERQVADLARHTGKPPGTIIKEALRAYRESLEDTADLEEAREALKNPDSVPWEKVKKDLDL